MRRQIFLLTLGIAVTGSNSLVLSPILADVAMGLGTTPVVVSRALAAYGGATALSAFLLAPRIDRVGPRRALSAGMAALSVATLVSAASTHWLVLVLAQIVAGIGAGIVLPSIYALATTIAPKGAESAVLGRVLVGWSVSLVAGVPASALISDLAGWRASFLALGLLAAVSLLGSTWLPEGRRHQPQPQGLLAPLGYPTVRPLLLVCLAFMTAFYGVYAFLGDTLRATTGVTAGGAGLAVLTYGIGFGIASLADRRVDRLGAERVLPWSLAAVALIYLALVPATRALWSAALLTAVWGCANHLCLNSLIVLLARARPDRRGAVLGLNSAVTYVGALFGTGGAGLAYQQAGFAALGIIAAALLAVAALVAQIGADQRPQSAGAAARSMR